MKVIYIDLKNKEKIKMAVKEAVYYLEQGKIIVYPTDTIYGLSCDALNEQAVEKVYALKKRDRSKPLSVIVSDIEAIKKVAHVDGGTIRAAEKLLPGPYTLIYPAPRGFMKAVTGGKNSIGVRIPDNFICQELAKNFFNPIVTTSVNLSGEEALNDPFKIVEYFKEKNVAPDLILDCGKIKNAQPSMVIDLTRKNPQILRSGKRNIKEIMSILEKLKEF